MNGILNDRPDALALGNLIAEKTGRDVDVVWNPTVGQSLKGGFLDGAQLFLVNKPGFADETTRKLTEHLRSRVAALQKGETLFAFAHSQGAAILSTATGFLTATERARIDVVTYAGAAYSFPSGFHSERHLVSYGDVVPMFLGKGFAAPFDPDVFALPLPLFSHSASSYINPPPTRTPPAEREWRGHPF